MRRQPEDDRIHGRAGNESIAAHAEQRFHTVMVCHDGGYRAIGFRTRMRRQSATHFVLNHEHRAPDLVSMVDQPFKDGSRDSVGQVGHEHEPGGAVCIHQFGQVQVEHVPVHDGQVAVASIGRLKGSC